MSLGLLTNDPPYPSLDIKKTKGEVLRGYHNVFEGGFSKSYGFLFLIDGDTYVLLR